MNKHPESITTALFEDGASFNALTFIVSIVAILVAATAVLYQRKSIPRRRLDITIGAVAPLASATSVSGLDISHNGTSLTNPHITGIELKNSGKVDLPSSQFDQSEPLAIDFHAPIVEAVQEADPLATFRPTWSKSGSIISVGPTLLPRGSIASFQVLTDGEPNITTQAELTDTEVSISKRGATVTPRPILGKRTGQAAVAIMAAFAIFTGVMSFKLITEGSLKTTKIEIAEASVTPGGKIAVWGKNFPSNSIVLIELRCIGSEYHDKTEVGANSEGGFRKVITIPRRNPKPWEAESCDVFAVNLYPWNQKDVISMDHFDLQVP
ncbi:hypothetical protein [Streptomyces sp. NBC_00203]|uniref:hypothetical protein n=1 Tax=Streptomyces sp. NBC_00203 TaxID=2975680 RepID=UPI003253C80A